MDVDSPKKYRGEHFLLSLLAAIGLYALGISILPLFTGDRDISSLHFSLSTSPYEPILFLLLFAFSYQIALKAGGRWAVFSCLPFLALAILPVISDGEENSISKNVAALEADIETQRALLAGLQASLVALTSRVNSVKIVYNSDWLTGSRIAKQHNLGQPVKETFCYITAVAGQFEGRGEFGEIYEKNGTWHVRVGDQQRDIGFKVRCVHLPL